jgi:hypothetical protein
MPQFIGLPTPGVVLALELDVPAGRSQEVTPANIARSTGSKFEPMTGSLGTTPSIHHQLDSAGDTSAPACCTLASAPNPDYTRNSPPPLSHCFYHT